MFKFSNENSEDDTNWLTTSVDDWEPLDIKSSNIWYPITSFTSNAKLGVSGVQFLEISSTIVIWSIKGTACNLDSQILSFGLIPWGSGSYNFNIKDRSSFVFIDLPVATSSLNSDNVSVSIPHVATNLLLPSPKCK